MSLIHNIVQISNPTRPELHVSEVRALADSGAVHLCIPEHIAIQLQLRELEQRQVILADGHRRTVPHMGPIEVRPGISPWAKGSHAAALTWLPEIDPR